MNAMYADVRGFFFCLRKRFRWKLTDYVEISRRLYEGQTIDEIFERAKGLWKG